MITIYDHFANPFMKELGEVSWRMKDGYGTADPFPHCCIDGLISSELLDCVLQEFPEVSKDKTWIPLEEEGRSHRKQITKNPETSLGPYTKYLISRLSGPSFLGFLEQVTGITGLMPDPYLQGAGLHQMGSGGFLEMHVDFHKSRKLNLYRRLNLLLYLNKDWKEEYRGHLELWDKNLQKRAEYLPIWNRMLICNIAPLAYHGFPHPIQCPEDMTRKALAIWYYTADLPEEVKQQYLLHKPNWINRELLTGDHDHDHDHDGEYAHGE